MANTLTGNFPIGFRRGGSPWQKNLADVIAFAKENAFSALDVGDLPAQQVKTVLDAGLRIGSVDLKQPWSAVAVADKGKRKDSVAAAADHIKSVSKLGVRNFFTVVFPENDAGDRKENFKLAVAGYGELAAAISSSGARIVIEGYPGSAPHFSALVCTPETYRAFFREVGSDVMMVNYDPSHLVRMGIDYLRFLKEFGNRVGHVHAKNTEISAEGLYEFGNLQSKLEPRKGWFGGPSWRYALPGVGNASWPEILHELKELKFDGVVSIELEDDNFNGTTDGEKRGLITAREYLART